MKEQTKVKEQVTTIRAIIFILCSVFLMTPLPLPSDEVSEIRALYNKINKAINEKKTAEILFYTTPDGYAEKRWIRVKSTDPAILFENSYFKAKMYLLHNKVVKAAITIVSQAGDWTNNQEYYFFENGRTAFLFESHLTYLGYNFDEDKNLPAGPYIIEKRIYFNKTGKEVRSVKKAFRASTKEEIPIKYLQQIELEIYPDVASLPFGEALTR